VDQAIAIPISNENKPTLVVIETKPEELKVIQNNTNTNGTNGTTIGNENKNTVTPEDGSVAPGLNELDRKKNAQKDLVYL